LIVQLAREGDDDDDMGEGGDVVPTVIASRYPKEKLEGWWLVVGEKRESDNPDEKEVLISVKKVTLKKKQRVKMDFTASSTVGEVQYSLYLVSDSYIGCDQVFDFSLTISEQTGMDEDN
jgi:pre-mRNA-splicing helicase BRR2